MHALHFSNVKTECERGTLCDIPKFAITFFRTNNNGIADVQNVRNPIAARTCSEVAFANAQLDNSRNSLDY